MFTSEDVAAARAAIGILARHGAWGLGEPRLDTIEQEDDAIQMGEWVIHARQTDEGPQFDLSVGVVVPSSSRWEPDDYDHQTVGTYETLDDALCAIGTECIRDALKGHRQAEAEARAAADDAVFWAEQAEYVRSMINHKAEI